MSHPFFDDQPKGASHPFFDDLGSKEELASSAIGRMTLEQQDKEKQRQALLEIFNKTTDHKQKERIAKFLAASAQEQDKNGVVGNLARGAAGGLVKGAMTSADLAGMLIPGETGTALRRSVQEAGQNLNEITGVDQNSTAGQIGEFAGSMAGAMLPMGGVARGTGAVLSKLVPAARPLLTGAVEGSMITRAGASAAANVATGLPLNMLQAGTLPEGTTEEKVQQLMEQVGADVLFGALFHPSSTQAGAAKLRMIEKGKAPEVVAPKVDSRESIIAELQAKAEADRLARERAKEMDKEARRIARIDWESANKDKKWSELSKEQKKKITEKWLEDNPGAVTPKVVETASADAGTSGMTSEQAADFMGELATEQAKSPEVDPVAELKAKMASGEKTLDPNFKPAIDPVEAFSRVGEGNISVVPYFPANTVFSGNGWFEQLVRIPKQVVKEAADKLRADIKALEGDRELKLDVRRAEAWRSVLNEMDDRVNNWADASVIPENKVAPSPKLDKPQTPAELIRQASAADPFMTHTEIAKQLNLPVEQVKIVLDEGRFPHSSSATTYGEDVNNAEAQANTDTTLPASVVSPDVAELQTVWNSMTSREREAALKATGKGSRALRDLSKDKSWEALQADPDRMERMLEVLKPNLDALREAKIQQALELERVKNEAPTKMAEDQRPVAEQLGRQVEELAQVHEVDLQTLRKHLQTAARTSKEGMTPEIRLRAGEQVAQLQKQIAQAEKLQQQTVAPAVEKLTKITDTLDAVVPEPLKEPPALHPSRRQTVAANLTNEELTVAKNRYEWEMAEATEATDKAKQTVLTERLKRIEKEIKRRQEVSASGSEGLKAQMPVELGSFGLGFTGSILHDVSNPDQSKSDEDILRNAFLTGTASLLAGHGLKRLHNYHAGKGVAPKSPLEVPGLNLSKDSPVVTKESLPEKVVPWMSKFRRSYYSTLRSSGGAEYAVDQTGGTNLPTEKNPGKRMFLFGRYIGQTENALTNRLAYEGPDGNSVVIEGVQTPHQILKSVGMDKEGLGNVAVALASAEGAGKRNVPMDQVTREAIIRAAPPEYIQAAQELRKYNLGLMEILLRSGRISEEGFKEMASEDWYTPLQRVLDNMGKSELRKSKNAKQPESLYGRKGGSDAKVLNPVDATIDMTARVMRAAEYGKTINSLIDYVESKPSSVGAAIAHPVHRSTNKAIGEIERAAAELQKVMKISRADAESMLTYMHLSNEAMKDGVVTAWRNGKLSSWKVNSEVFDSIKAMMPYETDELVKWLSAPARVASKGVVMNPAFLGMQFMVDSISAGLFSKYGFRPGWDSFRGWWHDVSNSPKYRQMMDLGGPSTIQSLDYTNPKWASQAVSDVGSNKLQTAWNQVKDLHPWQAYKTLVMPVAEAARVGEYLRALDHGASTLEAVYASWDILGNPRMQGSAPMMRAINMMSMFTRPSLAALDKLAKETGLGPWTPERDKTWLGKATSGLNPRAAASVNLGTKVFTGITLPSILLWSAQKDDEEVRQIRQTPAGAKYWIIRGMDSKIYRIRKPYVLGEIFGTAVENILDEKYTNDPGQVNSAVQGLAQDASVNILPLIGVIPYSLFVNKDLGSGFPIVPERDGKLPSNLAGYTSASKFGQIAGGASEALPDWTPDVIKSAFSPKGVDYVVGSVGGMLGRDFLKLISGAADWKESHKLPPTEELPVIASFMSKYPSTNVKELGEFYRWAEQVDNSVKGLDFYLANKPQKAFDYAHTHMGELGIASLASDTRKQIGDMRRAIDDLRKAPPSVVSIERRREIEKQMIQNMIDLARAANYGALKMGLR